MEGLLLLEEFDVTQLKSGDLSLKVEIQNAGVISVINDGCHQEIVNYQLISRFQVETFFDCNLGNESIHFLQKRS